MGKHRSLLPEAADLPELADFHPEEDELKHTLLAGLRRPQKRLPSLYFYDEKGSELFDLITELKEYYPTRTELAIMEQNMSEMVALIGEQASLIEYGSGSSYKTRLLLDHLHKLACYVPVDISRDFLMSTAEQLARDYPHIEILPVCADFTQPFDLPEPKIWPERNIVYFPGSTIGNFDPAGALALLRVMRGEAKDGGAALIGVDLEKDRTVLEPAYNDAEGVTARFNLNMLARLNAEYGGDFVLPAFNHRAIWNADEHRIEMHLVSECDQVAHVAGEAFHFHQGEYILTEWSYKYTRERFAKLAQEAGFRVERVWTDENDLFSIQYLVCAA